MKVAPRKTTSGYRSGHGCVICDLTDEEMQRINAEVWDGVGQRTRGYRARGQSAYYTITGKQLDAKTVTRHADHIEDTWRDVTPNAPAAAAEVPIFASDYKSITERAANLGVYAMTKLEQQVGRDRVEPRELIMMAKMGVTARANEEANRVAESRPTTNVSLIFGLAGGHLRGEFPEHEAIDVTPERELLDEIAAERQALAGAATGQHFDDLFD